MRTIIDTTAGAGDTLKAGGDKVNAMTAELFGKVDGLLGGRKARIATIGNSHSTKQSLVPAILYSLFRYYAADVWFDYRTQQDQTNFDATRGDVFGIGGTTTTQMVNTQLPKLQAAIAAGRVYDLLYIGDGGYNDQYGSAAAVATGVGNIITTAKAALTAGVKLVVVMGLMPADTTGNYFASSWQQEANQQLRVFASITPGVAFLDLTSIFANHNDATVYLHKAAGNVYQGMTVDGVHLSGYGMRLLAPYLVPFHQAIARKRVPRTFGNTGTFDPANLPSINILGDAGNIQGTAGIKNSGAGGGTVAGVDGSSRIFVTDNADLTLTTSIVTGTDGFKRQRVTLGGTSNGNTAQVQWATGGNSNVNNGVATRGYDCEAVVELTGVTGLVDLWGQTVNGASAFGSFQGGASALANLWPDGTTETLFLYSTFADTYAAGAATAYFPASFYIASGAGKTPSGTIDFSRVSYQRVSD